MFVRVLVLSETVLVIVIVRFHAHEFIFIGSITISIPIARTSTSMIYTVSGNAIVVISAISAWVVSIRLYWTITATSLLTIMA